VAFDLLSRKAWTRRELTARLRRRGAPADVARGVIADLEARGYVDDEAFATRWVESRAGGRGLGRRRLRQELLARGVARPLVETGLLAAGSPEDELGRARALAARRVPVLRRLAPERAARRLHDYLLRRGFPAGVVRRVVREHWSISTEDD
jgi:regulatory protein